MDNSLGLPLDKNIAVSFRTGVTIASSGTDEIGKNFVQLEICHNDQDEQKTIFTEMTVEQLYKFIEDVKKANSSEEYLKKYC